MNGHITAYGYAALVAGRWMLFATEVEHLEYISEERLK